MNPVSRFSGFDVDGEQRRYLQDDGTLFWPWLQSYLGDRYEQFRQQPLSFVRQIFTAEWNAYIREQVVKVQRKYYNELINDVTLETQNPQRLDSIMQYLFELRES